MGLRPHDFETGSSRRVTLQPYVSRRRRLPLLPRERFSPWVETGLSASRLKRERRAGHPSYIFCLTLMVPQPSSRYAGRREAVGKGRRFGRLITFPFARATLKIAFAV